MAKELDGAGISRSTIYDAFASTRLPNWHVVEALVEVLATKHPRTTPEQEAETFYALWLLAVGDEGGEPPHEDQRDRPEGSPDGTGDHLSIRMTGFEGSAVAAMLTGGAVPLYTRTAAIFNRRYEGRIWLQVPYELKTQAKELGARWDPDYKLWFVEGPVPELMRYQVPGPHPPRVELGDTSAG
ncbi:DUF5710 domain-containing protein [Streptomyces virginiae]|uniref:DUF5710 domain-containing protein n=1 Tax=Streptomyces virginiae TaxID=1961 RepID=UPI0033266293